MRNKEYKEIYSSIAYSLIGFLALYLHQDIISLLFCMGMQGAGIAAFIYHMDKSANRRSDTIWKFDWWSIHFMNTIVAGIHFNSIEVWGYLLIIHAVYGFFLLGRFNVYIEVTASSLVSMFALYLNRSTWTFLIVLIAIIISLVVRAQDKDTKQLTNHDSTYHAIWHFLSAGTYYLSVYLNI